MIDPTPASLDVLLASLDPDRFYVDVDTARDALHRRSMFNVIDTATGWKLDLVIRKDRPFSIEELARRVHVRIVGADVPAATAEDTVIAKLEWAREGGSDRQLRDVAGILAVSGDRLDHAYLERWITELELQEQWARARGF
ncbi:MAG: hypothetical protein ABI467_20920 [Kofleriaceae bacterium]